MRITDMLSQLEHVLSTNPNSMVMDYSGVHIRAIQVYGDDMMIYDSDGAPRIVSKGVYLYTTSPNSSCEPLTVSLLYDKLKMIFSDFKQNYQVMNDNGARVYYMVHKPGNDVHSEGLYLENTLSMDLDNEIREGLAYAVTNDTGDITDFFKELGIRGVKLIDLKDTDWYNVGALVARWYKWEE